jgi:hypothetical protein
MCTSRPGWQTMSLSKPKYKNKLFNVDINLIDILEIDVEKQVYIVLQHITVKYVHNILMYQNLLAHLHWVIDFQPLF